MAYFYEEPSHTFGEYLLIPGYTSADCIPDNVSLKTPVVRYNKKAGEKSDLYSSSSRPSNSLLAGAPGWGFSLKRWC